MIQTEQQKRKVKQLKNQESPEQLRRQFLKKFGKYAASVPVATFTLMSPAKSSSSGSGDFGG